MSKVKYRLTRYGIEPVEFVRETEHFIVTVGYRGKESRQAKVSSWDSFHDSWDAAHAVMVAQAEREVESAQERLQAEREKLERIKAMRKPEDAA